MSTVPGLPGGPTGLAFAAGKAANAAIHKPWTTPRRMKAFRTTTWALAAIMFFLGESTLNHARTTLRTIAKDTAPGIVAAADIGTALADVDTAVASGILGNAATRTRTDAEVEDKRTQASQGILRAAENITGNAERAPIGRLNLAMGRYLEKQSEARLLHDTGDEGAARDRYWTASALLHDQLLPAADELDDTKRSQLELSYRAQRIQDEGAEGVVGAFGLAQILILAWAQWFLYRRTRRMLSVPLLAATALAVGLTGYLIHAFSDTRENLRIAKFDAFDSIYALVRARTIAHDARGEMSRWLLDPSPLRGIELQYKKKVALLSATPDLQSAALHDLTAANPGQKHPWSPSEPGMLWDEVRNVTFNGEYPAAYAMMRAYADTYALDGSIKNLEQKGHHADAVELCVGTRSDEAKAVFDRFDDALKKTLAINQAAFDDATGRAEAELKRAETLDPGLGILIAVFAWLGFRPRLREYEA